MKGRQSNSGQGAPRLKKGRLMAGFTLAVCVTLAAGCLSGEQLTVFGRNMALLSVGIMQPEGGAQALSDRLERLLAKQSSSSSKVESESSTTSYTPGSDQSLQQVNTSETSEGIPAEKGDGGKVTEEQVTIGSDFVQGVAIKNASSQTIDVAAQLAIKPNLGITDTDQPQVLIVHTHTTEAYMTYFAGFYNACDIERSTNGKSSVIAAGEAIAEQLRAAGINVIHDTTIHDSPQYTGAYDRSAETIQKYLAQYPTICVVLDIHRDSINRSDTERVKPTAVINGQKAAQMMIITSVCDSAALPHPDWAENLRFALRLQSALNTQYEGIVRPLYLVDSRYNEHLTHGSLLIEIGSDVNTVSEAVYSGQILGKTLSEVLNSLM